MSGNDAESVTAEHARIIRALTISTSPEVMIYKRIPGFGEATEPAYLQRGIHLASLGQQFGRRFSTRQDKRFGTLVVLCEGTSTTSAEVGSRVLPEWQKVISDAFENARATELSCELISQTRELSMRMPVALAMQYDVIGFEIWSYFREHR
jgi:hypothetical protein